MKKTLLSLFLGLSYCTALFSQTQLSTSDMTSLFKTSPRPFASIHDPSVVWDSSSKSFYIFGSHYVGAKTKDFNNYTMINNFYSGGYNTFEAYKAFKSNPSHTIQRRLPGTAVDEEMTLGSYDASSFCSIYNANGESSHVSGNQWAPDILYNPNLKKWCYYLSLNGDNWASVIVLMTADKPEGPYTYNAPIVFGGFNNQSYTVGSTKKKVNYKDTDLEIVLGKQSSLPARYNKSNWGSFWPNCIDPCVFFDENGELWMSYGSWSGGIWLLKLDKNTGLRDYTHTYNGTSSNVTTQQMSDAYFGKLIAGGCYVSGEGSYIQHIGDYYYLFMSYGFYSPDGGYEMRVFRSQNPDGPYVDASGASATYTSYMMNYGPSARTNRGMKLIGAYNHWGVKSVGECAQGHNSACQDDKGRTFLMCHTKFNDGTVGHQMRAYQLFLNKQGWLCTAPFQYKGEVANDDSIASSQAFTAEEMEGDYHVLIHPYKLNYEKYEEAEPGVIHLSVDGKVTGDYTGNWKYTDEGKSYFSISLKPKGSTVSTTYSGVVIEQTLEGTSAKAIAFTSVAVTGTNSGVPCWGYKLQPKYALSYNYQKYGSHFKASNVSYVTKNISVMFDPEENVKLSWESSEPAVVTNDGKFCPRDTIVPFAFTARMDCGDYYWTQEYQCKAAKKTSVSGDATTGLVAYYTFDEIPTYNMMDDNDKVFYGRSNTNTAQTPVLCNDWNRFGNVVHQYFGVNGANSYSRIPNPLLNKNDLDGFTVSMWVKRTDSNNYDALWSFFNSTNPAADQPRLFFTGNSYLGFNDTKGNWFDVNHPDKKVVSSISVGEWNLVTLTYSKDKGYKLYLNGTAYLSSNLVWNGSTSRGADFDKSLLLDFVKSAKYFCLGLGSFWGSADVCFDDLMIYDRELSSIDVKALNTYSNRVYDFTSGVATSVESVESNTKATSQGNTHKTVSGVYDVTGRRVNPIARGIYVVDGKKVFK